MLSLDSMHPAIIAALIFFYMIIVVLLPEHGVLDRARRQMRFRILSWIIFEQVGGLAAIGVLHNVMGPDQYSKTMFAMMINHVTNKLWLLLFFKFRRPYVAFFTILAHLGTISVTVAYIVQARAWLALVLWFPYIPIAAYAAYFNSRALF